MGLGLPILWTATHSHGQSADSDDIEALDILEVVRLCCVNTSKQVGLSHRKGAIAPGMDADICVFDPEGSFVLQKEAMLWRNKVSPYQGRRMYGVVKETYLRGNSVFKRRAPGVVEGGFEGGAPKGVLLLEKRKS